ncbi:SOS response-associated peptidase family protein [Zobellia galactanivorans]|uniref:SOS response-associated peptidase family protein n=1 Tax=Zobellia galactanivorans (strain DSM 12802 / CCUG 47099 / CIP 106680 / NCIMB 13871 / Dsij) TaxID=63186 RepID=UPI0026E135E5|nr:SOS response-associated peptidase family protein [Zobellia galactanivorans]MDO6810444.1 SOS response-associated peptidase family protein [Zobellia galactanivorans]
MYNKLSIRADRERIEQAYGAHFRFPDIYKPRPTVNGLEESTVPIITSRQQKTIITSIWGLLPKKFQGDWAVFQKHVNTLSVPWTSLYSKPWYAQTEETERCLLIVTGFFTTFVHEGEPLFFHMAQESGKPFCLAGICNELEDGFVTSALITRKAYGSFSEVHNIDDQMPVLIPDHQHREWLEDKISVNEVDLSATLTLTAEAVAEDYLYDMHSDAYGDLPHLKEEDFLPTSLSELLYQNNIYLDEN